MYRTATGEEIFMIDGHTHNWDGSPDNIRTFMASSSSNAFTAIIPSSARRRQKWP